MVLKYSGTQSPYCTWIGNYLWWKFTWKSTFGRVWKYLQILILKESKIGPKMYIIKVYHQSWKQMRSLENCSEENWHRRPLKCILNVSLSNVDKSVHSALLCYDSNVLKEPCRNIFWGNRSKTVIRSVNIYQLAFLEN